MQQPWSVQPLAAGIPSAPAQSTTSQAVWRYGLIFGLVNGVLATLQAVVSVWGAVESQPALASLYYGTHGVGFDPSLLLGWVGPLLTVSYGTCLLGFALSLWLCWHAGRAAASAAGRRAAGTLAGLLTSALGSLIWIVASVAAVLVAHTDGTVTGVLFATPDRTTANLGGEVAGLVIQEVAAGAIALGFGALAGRIGAGRVSARAVRAPMVAVLSPAGSVAAPLPTYPPYGAAPAPWPVVYPPPPELYRQPGPGVGVPGYPPTGVPGYAPYGAYPGYMPPPGYPAAPGLPPGSASGPAAPLPPAVTPAEQTGGEQRSAPEGEQGGQ